VQVPYRALRPSGWEGLLVVGRAWSVTHDALALARMQRDLMALGAAGGLAAARSAAGGQPLGSIDVRALQRELVALGVLGEEDLAQVAGAADSALPALSDGELRGLVARLAAGKATLAEKVQLLARPRRAVAPLKEALAAADAAARGPLARALGFLGERDAADVLLAELARRLEAGKLPLRIFPRQNPSPDHAYAPEICFLLNLLGRLGERRLAGHLTEIARRVRMNPRRSDMMFQYVFSVCYAAERLGDEACEEALAILASKEGLRGNLLRRGTDPRRTQSPRAERYAYLELCVARARARCGSRAGYRTLLACLGETRAFLARSAHDELVALAGRDFGYDAGAWRRWLAGAKISPRPYR
jgi:hypothetical protein